MHACYAAALPAGQASVSFLPCLNQSPYRRRLMRKRTTAWLIAAAVLVVIPLITAYFRERAAVGSCKEAGGSYNYALKMCDMAATHEYIPFGQRHMGLLGITLMVLLALAIAKYVKWNRRLNE